MSLRSKIGVALTLCILLVSRAAAQPSAPCMEGNPCHLRMREPTTLNKDSGESYRLPPGRFLDEPTFENLDTELKRLQDSETRLTAENKTFRENMNSWSPGWFTVTIAVVFGAAAGVGGYYWYENR